MSLFKSLTLLAIVAIAIPLAIAVVRFNRKRRYIESAASAASSKQLNSIYEQIEQVGTVPSNGFVLAHSNELSSETRCLVPVPELANFPWAGRVVEITADTDVHFHFVDSTVTEPTLLGRVYRPVSIPRHKTKNAQKERNVFSPERYLIHNEKLHLALSEICPKYPSELLSYLLCIGRESYEFEPIDQARIGTSPAWVQDPENQTCPECNRRMQLILQIPGTVISKRAFHRGTFYLFGCNRHPHQTKSIGQFT
ncbi:hypothetical protein [Chitinibacter tainanensis]|uniref:hypothetical protein n=1 Tax=Chitinibacter tainanensis TaxID=230667 RepID=UPI00235234DE|nr:hypothetical protein [Chitinibacter tainanensis]